MIVKTEFITVRPLLSYLPNVQTDSLYKKKGKIFYNPDNLSSHLYGVLGLEINDKAL